MAQRKQKRTNWGGHVLRDRYIIVAVVDRRKTHLVLQEDNYFLLTR
jgi:hypothetical protein